MVLQALPQDVGFRQNPPSCSLHITGPRQCPRVDKPHAASITSTLPAVAGCAREEVAKVMRNCSCVTDWHDRKFSKNILNWDCDEHPKKMTAAQTVNPRTDVPCEARSLQIQHSTLEVSPDHNNHPLVGAAWFDDL